MACRAVALPRAALYLFRSRSRITESKDPPTPPSPKPKKRKRIPRRLSDAQRAEIVNIMHSERFCDQTVREVWATLLDENVYLGSIRTFYRILSDVGESKERRHQRAKKSHATPRLTATVPNEVWTWDITKLATHTPGKFLNLYLVIDLWSRYVVGWMVAEKENSSLAKHLIATTVSRYGMSGQVLTLHNDRGSPMTALGFMELLAELSVNSSRSRPRVSNDNPHSESINKTLKYQPDYPGRFETLAHARGWVADFIDWYNNHHCHSGLALFRPGDLFFDRVTTLAAGRQNALDRAYGRHPERFVHGPPKAGLPPQAVFINPIDPGEPLSQPS